MKNNKPVILILVLNAAAVLFYFFIVSRLLPLDQIPSNLYFTGDAREYWDYGQWIAGASEYCNPFRTFFYPLIVLVSTTLLGSYGPWIIQFIFWMASCNLVFLSLRSLTGKPLHASIGFILCFTHLPLIGYSTHALTELTVFFLLSILIYTLAKNTHQLSSTNTLLKLLLIVSLLAVTKPVYQVVWYAALLCFLFFSLRSLKAPRTLLLLLLAASPVLVQKGINITAHDTLSSTDIADSNLKKYFYHKIRYYVEHPSVRDFSLLPDSVHIQQQQAIANVSTLDAVAFIAAHPGQTAVTFIENLKENIGSGYPYVGPENPRIAMLAGFYNKALMYLHIPVFICWIIFLLFFTKKIQKEHYLFILLSGLVLYYIYFTSGLVFWAGDRLISPATSLWISCYFIMGASLLSYKKAEQH